MDEHFSAKGRLFYDDGVQMETKEYIDLSIQITNNTLSTSFLSDRSSVYKDKTLFIEKIELWGVETCNDRQTLNNDNQIVKIDCFTTPVGFKKMIIELSKGKFPLYNEIKLEW